jgi:hypothetical protein
LFSHDVLSNAHGRFEKGIELYAVTALDKATALDKKSTLTRLVKRELRG